MVLGSLILKNFYNHINYNPSKGGPASTCKWATQVEHANGHEFLIVLGWGLKMGLDPRRTPHSDVGNYTSNVLSEESG